MKFKWVVLFLATYFVVSTVVICLWSDVEIKSSSFSFIRNRHPNDNDDDETTSQQQQQHAQEDTNRIIPTSSKKKKAVVNNNNYIQKRKNKYPPYAYSFVLGGCDPDYPNYRPYLYGIFVSACILREQGSNSDIYLFLEMHYESHHKTLPKNELRVLKGLNVTLVPIPSMTSPSFYQLQLQKFRILGLTQYRRVFHLDSDLMPLCNLDYLFHYSDWQSDVWRKDFKQPPLQENFVITSPNDPSNGGNFILAPHPGDLQRINKIIQTKERKVAQGIPFDKKMGWGADIGRWDAVLQHGFGWTFLAASGDQGLLYYWVKYVKRKVSVQAGYGRFETWVPLPNGTGFLKNVSQWPIPSHNSVHLWRKGRSGVRKDFYHFMGVAKPWNQTFSDLSKKTMYKSADYYWQYCLKKIDKKFNVGIDFNNLGKKKAVPYSLKQPDGFEEDQITNLLT